MIVTCADCDKTYDDTYHLTYCPHEHFDMSTVCHRGDGETKVCTSVEELHEFMAAAE